MDWRSCRFGCTAGLVCSNGRMKRKSHITKGLRYVIRRRRRCVIKSKKNLIKSMRYNYD